MNAKQTPFDYSDVDTSDLNYMVSAYAKPVYTRLLTRCGDKDIALQSLKSALADLYTAVERTGCHDPMEAMLFLRAQQEQDELISRSDNKVQAEITDAVIPPEDTINMEELNRITPIIFPESKAEPLIMQQAEAADEKDAAEVAKAAPTENSDTQKSAEVQNKQAKKAKNSKKRNFWGILAIILLSIGMACMLWIIAGLVMSADILPRVDLGYNWFNSHIVPWF